LHKWDQGNLDGVSSPPSSPVCSRPLVIALLKNPF
jgi:hypothetical protein